MSVEVKKNNTVRFSYKSAGPVSDVYLAASFNNWVPLRMRKQKNGEFSVSVQVPYGTHEYKFIVDDAWQMDTDNELQATNTFGSMNSVVVVD
ncbi:MAG: glycogen-binding domain-containing protein [Planctomycetales bacterium]|nr:glycogen-binding domain-containing protein [Planctomycetales bacterium]